MLLLVLRFKIIIIFFSDKVLGRQKFDVKICAMPLRDKETEEKKDCNENTKNKVKAVKSPPAKGLFIICHI